MSRFSDVMPSAASIDPIPLPIVDWQRIGAKPPRVLDIAYGGPNAPLPAADAVVITWTAAEWSALDHVFVNSNGTRLPGAKDWQNGWYLYVKDAPPIPPSLQPPPPAQPAAGATPELTVNPALAKPAGPPPPLWGLYVLVEIQAKSGPLKVLLFKSNSHLAHAPGLSALADMTARIIDEVKPKHLYSIGTAGGTRLEQKLGDVVITNCGSIQLKDPINANYFGWNNQTYTCTDWFPSEDRVHAAREHLFFSLANVVTYPALQALVAKLHEQVPGSERIALEDVLNDPLLPERLHASSVIPMQGTPLLSTDFYFIADASDATQYSFLEMDDAVLAKVCVEKGVKCAFARNISDPIVPTKGADGSDLPPEVRKRWSGLIYETYGLYTSVNGAISTWATLAAI
jgi:nucleoside phosphorylase